MNINYHGKNITVTEDLKNLAEKKLSKLDKYFTEDISAKVIFEVNKKNQKIVEVTVFLPKDIIRSEVNEESFEDAIDRAIEILSRQVRKYKTKLKNRYVSNDSIRFENFEETKEEHESKEDTGKIVKEKSFQFKPMTSEEAILQMELLGHNFFVFSNPDTGDAEIVYKRQDGNYGLIERER